MMKRISVLIIPVIAILSCCAPEDGEHVLHVLSTNDIHGSYFDSTYVGGGVRRSLFSVKTVVDSLRSRFLPENVLLIDAGDCLQGDNASYYFNYVDTLTPHLFPRMAGYMGYDAVIVGNHDIEAGHPVYDRVRADLKKAGIPFLAGNVMDAASGKPYFDTFKMFRRAGLKVAVLGYTNANIKAWLDESLWAGLEFDSLLPLVRQDVDKVRALHKPDVVIVAVHSGTGNGDGSELESQGRDLYDSLEGVDVLVCSHDHRPLVFSDEGKCLINAGSHARFLAHAEVRVKVEGGKVVSKGYETSLIPVRAGDADQSMREEFTKDFEAVKAFTLKEVGTLETDLLTRDSYKGMCAYMNLIHTVSLSCGSALVSFAAPLTFNGRVKAGTLVFNDMFTIYPYENQLFVVEMTGKEIKDYLEYSYDGWINTISSSDEHLLKIREGENSRTGRKSWFFSGRSYNFDSAAGINYTVDVTKACGDRISITSMASGEPFSLTERYPVAMTSYRASGGGGHVVKGGGISPEEMEKRIVRKYPEIRNLIYGYISGMDTLTASSLSGSGIGSWSFEPCELASAAMERDFALLFPESK